MSGLQDLSFHPLAGDALCTRFVALVYGELPDEGAATLLAERTQAAIENYQQVVLSEGEEPVDCQPLLGLFGTLLCEAHPYWYERSVGLRSLCAEAEIEIEGLISDPVELLRALLPPLAGRALRPSRGVWVVADDVPALRSALRAKAGKLRSCLEERGEFTYLAALVEALGFCEDRSLGLLELRGVCSLRSAPFPRMRRAFFDREPGSGDASWDARIGEHPLPVDPWRRARTRLDLGDDEGAMTVLLELLEELPADSPQLSLTWRMLAVAYRGAGRLQEAKAAIDEACTADADDEPSMLERLSLQVDLGERLPEAVTSLKEHLQAVMPTLSWDDLGWVDDSEVTASLQRPEHVASVMAIIGVAYLGMGFGEHAQALLESAHRISPDDEEIGRRLRALDLD